MPEGVQRCVRPYQTQRLMPKQPEVGAVSDGCVSCELLHPHKADPRPQTRLTRATDA